MAQSDTNRILAEPKAFRGSIELPEESYHVAFEIFTCADYSLQIRFISPTQELIRDIRVNSGQTGEKHEVYSLRGTSFDGSEFSSNDFHPVTPTWDELGGIIYNAELFDPLLSAPDRLSFERFFRGFEAFDSVRVETPLGVAGVEGAAGIKDRQKLSARVGVFCDRIENPDEWLSKVIPFIHHMHSGLSFIDGGWLRTPLERFSSPEGTRWYFHKGLSSPRELPPEHFLSNKQMLEALILNYFSDEPISGKVWDALSWMQMDTTNDDGRFLAAMTAIELWLSAEFHEEEFSYLSENEFQSLKDKLTNKIENSNVTDELKNSSVARIGTLRHYSLKRKVIEGFKRKNISREDISTSMLQEMITRRNDIVHRGKFCEKDEVWEFVLLARELITRIVLNGLDYRGSYDSYLGGAQHRRMFPSCERQ